MKKYLKLFKYELKTILKDGMNLFMLFYPVLMFFIMGFLLPQILEKTGSLHTEGASIALLVSFTVILSIGGYIAGALLGFLILEHKDESTLLSIAVTPMSLSGYLTFKMIYTTILSFFGNIVMIGGIKLIASEAYTIEMGGLAIGLFDHIGWGDIILFSLVNSLIVPLIASFFGGIAKNKIEGFAYMKFGGFFIVLPALALLPFFSDWKQYLLGIFPNFWSVKAILIESLGSHQAADMNLYGYLAIGFVFQIIITVFCIKILSKKII
ncbi:MAG: hypothetical protein PHY42_03095 [Bacilli bacterium]|nr:hypothetical protein [Bacilli bacterium]